MKTALATIVLAAATLPCVAQQSCVLPPDRPAEQTGVHGNDERIELKYVALYQQLVEETVRTVSR